MHELRTTLGLTWPAAGTLGTVFLLALVGGTAIAMVLGRLSDPDPTRSGLLLVSLIVWQPLVEEMLFRGALQGQLLRAARLARPTLGFTLANLLSACAFAVAHLVHQPPVWALATLVPALLFGWFRDRTGSLVPAFLLHAAFNAGFFVAL